jgi:hypothetical protein
LICDNATSASSAKASLCMPLPFLERYDFRQLWNVIDWARVGNEKKRFWKFRRDICRSRNKVSVSQGTSVASAAVQRHFDVDHNHGGQLGLAHRVTVYFGHWNLQN